MKLVADFNDFLVDTVNLNASRVELLEGSIEALKGAVRTSDWGPTIRGFSAQGSWAHKTIIKPLPNDPFDADLLVYVNPVEGWEAEEYVNELHSAFSGLPTYKDKLRRYSHCLTIEYAGERKVDIAPCVVERVYSDTLEVCNRDTNEFEVSKPTEYTEWLIGKNSTIGGNNFRKVTRLLKYLRDIKTNFTCPSFLLTTLLGNQVFASDDGSNAFSDVPASLKMLIGRLDDWLQAHPTLPTVRNPVLFDEIQSSAWDATKYENFRSKINLYRGWIDDAYDESDNEESIGKWQRVFGDDFATREVVAKAAGVSESAIAPYRGNPVFEGVSDLIGLVQKIGRAALPVGFERLPHMRRPKWRVAAGGSLAISVSAQLYTGKHGQPVRSVHGLELLPSGGWIGFSARNNVGLPFPDSYKVMWRVTNTDSAALRARALRGDFYSSDPPYERWEQLSYRGVHMVEAFLIRKADEVQLGKSPPFYVAIA
jgi:Second Messenger Oligonucleotide or Dinucleotide Synthetase domain/Adenylyl/Guanylyl and SMODS C-terminal sensor domain